ncbi:MAG TPA: N-6 DNA methylase, partial [Polyangiaceae bacterium]|nr:N-6 DNA methylase [Polyangiaceae bacterium]
LEKDAEVEVAACRELGAPVVFVCHERGVTWWRQGASGPKPWKEITADELQAFAEQERETFAPSALYRAKTQSRFNPQLRLPFVDELLMPTIERAIGQRLGEVIDSVFGELRQQVGGERLTDEATHQLLKDAFWLLAAKILRDKDVPSFRGIDLTDAREVLKRVGEHYGEPDQILHKKPKHLAVMGRAAERIAAVSHLGQVTTEALAYLYETTLVTGELRRTLGIHSTPPYLTDYILGRLEDRIERIPPEDRHVFEPACGHGAFLVAAMRRLRDLLPEGEGSHSYLQQHLRGLEVDATAREIARLSLTLADIPNPDGWRLDLADMFRGNILPELASQATILLANPPFESFTPAERERYRMAGTPVTHESRAEEMLWRTLPHLPAGAAFGVVVPQGILRSKGGRELRSLIARDFSIEEVLLLPDNVFAFADVEAAILIGHRAKSDAPRLVRYRRVRESEIADFRATYRTPSDRSILQDELAREPHFDLRLPELYEIWRRGQGRSLSDVAVVGLGFQHKSQNELEADAQTVSKKRFAGAVRGYARVGRGLQIHGQPEEVWLNVRKDVIARPRAGTAVGRPQVLVNHRPTDRGPWRLKAVFDAEGHAARDAFLIVRPRSPDMPLEVVWALLNSAYANAYAYTHATKRDIDPGVLSAMPVPRISAEDAAALTQEVQGYLRDAADLERAALKLPAQVAACQARLRRIDALVLRLYDLPPRLERRLFDLFASAGEDRSGVPFSWPPYLPDGFTRRVPLYIAMGAKDAALAEVPAVIEAPSHLASENLHRAAPSDLEEEIEMISEELASLSNFRAESRPTAALAARAEAQRQRLRALQEEDVRRLSEAASRDRPKRHEEVD